MHVTKLLFGSPKTQKYIHRLMSIISLVLLFLSCTSLVSCTKDDEIVLLKIKKQLGDPDILSSWIKGFNFCNAGDFVNWHTTCNSDTGRVTSLSFSNMNNTSSFPDAICDLTDLETLSIDHLPGLYGSIPSCITQLFKLRFLWIAETSLSGSIPSFMYQTNLTDIYLRSSHFSGTIPASLSNLPNLNNLDLSSNNLTGTIPCGLVHFLPSGPDLHKGSPATLDLSSNSLTGELPMCLGGVNYFIINLANNQLCGDASFLFKTQVKGIILGNNMFQFDLSYVPSPFPLYALDLSHNKIYGKISDSLAGPFLFDLDLSFNKLCGEIPQGMSRFSATSFENNTCLCGYPLPPCSTSAPPPGAK